MPEGNTDAYREMYEMGAKLMQMAKDGGYSPDSSSEETTSDNTAPQTSNEDKVSTALKFYG